jgi:superfamily II DNA/RNA helicase
LKKNGFIAQSFHGNLEQEERNYTLDQFKDQKINILFCTDLASRGLHIDDVDCVVNYDLPRSVDDYIHRIGRTARAGKTGDAITFVTLENQEHFDLIVKKCKLDIKSEQIDGYERVGQIVSIAKGKEPIKGKRKSKKDKLREQNNHPLPLYK